jgi:hypothetical protein
MRSRHLLRPFHTLPVALGAIVLPLALFGHAQQAPRAPSLAELVPASTFAFVSVPDLGAAKAAFASTDIGKVCGALKPFVDEILVGLDPVIVDAKAKFEHNTGLSADQVLGALGGGVEWAVLELGPDGTPRGVVALVRTEGREAAVRALVEKLREQMGRRPGQGRPDAPRPPFVLELPGAMLLTESPEALEGYRHIVAGQVPSGFTPLARGPEFQAVREKALGGGVPFAYAYANLSGLIDRTVKEDAGAARVFYQTGLRDLRALGAGIAIRDGKLGLGLAVHAPAQGERRGVLSILAHGPVPAAALAKLAPQDAIAFGAWSLDLGLVYDRTLALVDAIDERAGRKAHEAIAELEKELGVGIRGDLLGPLGSDWAAISFVPEGGGTPVGVLTVSIKDELRFEMALRHMTERLGLETPEVTRAGRTIRYLRARLGRLGEDPFGRGGPSPQAVAAIAVGLLGNAYSVEGGRLYFADMPQTLDEYFSRSRAGGDLTTNADFQAALKAAGPSASAFSYMDPRPTFPAIWNSLLRLAHIFEGPVRMAGVPVDLALLPSGAEFGRLLLPGSAEVVIDQDGLAFRSRAAAMGLDLSGASMVAIIAAIAIPNLIEARMGANEAAAIGALRTITTAQMLYREADKDMNEKLDYAPDLKALFLHGHLIDSVLASGEKQGYRFEILWADQFRFAARAVPLAPGKSGRRSFFVDETGVIRFSVWPDEAGPESVPIGG